MSERAAELTRFVQEELEKVRNPEKAVQMQSYLKTDMPMYGALKKARTPILRKMKRQFPPTDRDEYKRNVLALWSLPHREEKYAAITYAEQFKQFITSDAVPLYEQLIREGAWWDLVDGVAIKLIGRVLLSERKLMSPRVDEYVQDDSMWVRRTALIAHNKHREQTNQEQLFSHCHQLAPEKEFFIRKAIGWALREYSKTEPEAVRDFLLENRNELSGLSFREGAKQLKREGLLS